MLGVATILRANTAEVGKAHAPTRRSDGQFEPDMRTGGANVARGQGVVGLKGVLHRPGSLEATTCGAVLVGRRTLSIITLPPAQQRL